MRLNNLEMLKNVGFKVRNTLFFEKTNYTSKACLLGCSIMYSLPFFINRFSRCDWFGRHRKRYRGLPAACDYELSTTPIMKQIR